SIAGDRIENRYHGAGSPARGRGRRYSLFRPDAALAVPVNGRLPLGRDLIAAGESLLPLHRFGSGVRGPGHRSSGARSGAENAVASSEPAAAEFSSSATRGTLRQQYCRENRHQTDDRRFHKNLVNNSKL